MLNREFGAETTRPSLAANEVALALALQQLSRSAGILISASRRRVMALDGKEEEAKMSEDISIGEGTTQLSSLLVILSDQVANLFQQLVKELRVTDQRLRDLETKAQKVGRGASSACLALIDGGPFVQAYDAKEEKRKQAEEAKAKAQAEKVGHVFQR